MTKLKLDLGAKGVIDERKELDPLQPGGQVLVVVATYRHTYQTTARLAP